MIKNLLVTIVSLLGVGCAHAQSDTLRIMSYNVLHYGDNPACQDPHSVSHNYLKTIVAYMSPDVLGLIKMEAFPVAPGDHSGTAPAGFPDSIIQYALNAAFPSRYAYCTYTNVPATDDMAVLFYDRQKLGFSGIVSSYSNITDFNTYKLYYKSADLATTHDTVFLYVMLNHTNSGGSGSDQAIRAAQISGEMAQLALHFSSLPDVINMGDFNTHKSTETCYQQLVNPANAGFRFYDPPFYPDAIYSYPADWDSNPGDYAACLTTSTRLSGSVPNSCGTSGGGKSWYDHMFFSSSIIGHAGKVGYVPHSFKVVGNDGHRTNISVNDAPANTSAPADVIDALFHMSNKYPISAQIVIGAADAPANVMPLAMPALIQAVNPIHGSLMLHIAPSVHNKDVTVSLTDATGIQRFQETFRATGEKVESAIEPGDWRILPSVL